MNLVRTDLAIESAAIFNKSKADLDKIKGVRVINENSDGIHITRVCVDNETGAETIGKPIGTYITIDMDSMTDKLDDYEKRLISILSDQLLSILEVKKDKPVFVVGLGNENITPDALGPKVTSMLNITRHLFDEAPELTVDNNRSVCAISPGVLGITGIETAEVIKGIADRVKPCAVICIDALATRSIKRLASSVQLTNTGITPGAGVGNRRHTINQETIGVPVIAIGVPTVVDGATIANDSIRLLCDALKSYSSGENIGFIERIDDNRRYSLVKELLKPYGEGLMVTPKEIDSLIDNIAGIISSSVNRAFGNE